MKRQNSVALLLGAALCLHAGGAAAERADRDKPVRLEADQVSIDDARQIGIFTGDVVMTQGTLSISGDQVVAMQGAGGFEHGTVTGKPAQFRQKREGLNEFVEGSGMRIEYNAVTGVMDIYGKAHVKRGQDEVRGDHITYDQRKETFLVSGGQPSQTGKPAEKGSGRSVVVINPKSASSVPPTTEPLPIKPETRLIAPEKKP